MIDYIGLMAGLTGIIAVIISLITASSAAKRSSFEELKDIVLTLRSELDMERKARIRLQAELEIERAKRMRFEDWGRRLVTQLEEKNIVPELFEEADR